MAGFEENIADNKAPCEGCPEFDRCPEYIEAGSKQCTIQLGLRRKDDDAQSLWESVK